MERQISKFKIVRRTSEYNKYIKWFVETYREDGTILSSAGYRTQREAREHAPYNHMFPIGNRQIQIIAEEIT